MMMDGNLVVGMLYCTKKSKYDVVHLTLISCYKTMILQFLRKDPLIHLNPKSLVLGFTQPGDTSLIFATHQD